MAGWYELLRLAERIEVLSAELYRLLADRFRADASASELFLRLECEETQHASRIRLLAARYRHDTKLLGRLGVDPAPLERLVAFAEDTVADVRCGGWGDDLGPVRLRLAETERRLSDAHAQFLAAGGHAELRSFFTQLAEQDEAHAQLLADGVPPSARARRASASDRAGAKPGDRQRRREWRSR